MLQAQPDDELQRMKRVCRRHCVTFARGPEKELADATRMLKMIITEERRRAAASLVVKGTVQ